GLNVDDQLELGRLHDRQIGWLGTFEDAANIDANLAKRIRKVRPVAHEPADVGKLPLRVARWNGMARRQMNQIDTPGTGKAGTGQKKHVRPLAGKGPEGFSDLADGGGVADLDLEPDGASRRRHVSQRGFGARGIGWID